MRTIAAAACFLVALDCVQNAQGDQYLFGEGLEWLWWAIAAMWFFQAGVFIFGRPTE